MGGSQVVRDLIYFDFDKCASIFSQLDGGLLSAIESSDSGIEGSDGGIEVDAKILRDRIARSGSTTISQMERRTLHHDLLNRVEELLFSYSMAIDLNTLDDTAEGLTIDVIHQHMAKFPYILVEGWSSIEDFQIIKNHMNSVGPLVDFFSSMQLAELKKTEQYQTAEAELTRREASLKSITDRNQKAAERAKIDSLKESMETQLANATKVNWLPDWRVSGFNQFIDALTPNRVNFRVAPFDAFPDFQCTANLKRDNFVDDDMNHLLYSYGSAPNVRLTMFGVVTSMPEIGSRRNVLHSNTVGTPSQSSPFDAMFRSLFSSSRGFEDLVKLCHYPSIVVSPLAVYRAIHAQN